MRRKPSSPRKRSRLNPASTSHQATSEMMLCLRSAEVFCRSTSKHHPAGSYATCLIVGVLEIMQNGLASSFIMVSSIRGGRKRQLPPASCPVPDASALFTIGTTWHAGTDAGQLGNGLHFGEEPNEKPYVLRWEPEWHIQLIPFGTSLRGRVRTMFCRIGSSKAGHLKVLYLCAAKLMLPGACACRLAEAMPCSADTVCWACPIASGLASTS